MVYKRIIERDCLLAVCDTETDIFNLTRIQCRTDLKWEDRFEMGAQSYHVITVGQSYI